MQYPMQFLVLVLSTLIVGYSDVTLSQQPTPAPSPPPAPKKCHYQGKWYAHGQTVTIADKPYKCVDGGWIAQ